MTDTGETIEQHALSREDRTLSAHDVNVEYKKFSLTVDSFTLQGGTITALLGPSGSGKSTLLNVLGLLERPRSGTVLFAGSPLTEKRARSHITAVFQRPYLMNGTVEHNVAYGLRLRRIPKPERRDRIRSVLALVGLDGFVDRPIAHLSGGEAQRVALARALVLEPSVLLLDEPLSSLDAGLKRRLSEDFARILRESNITTLYVTHDKHEALTVADSLAIMRDGRLVAQSSAPLLSLDYTDEWLRSFLQITYPLDARVIEIDGSHALVQAGRERISIPNDGYSPGERLRVSFAPEDVVVFESKQGH